MSRIIYFDNNATTQPLPAVTEAVARAMQEAYANPSSVHEFGQSVRHQVECARVQVGALIGATPKEMVFTSGGTESINLAIRGALRARPERRRVVTTAVEHSATLRVCEALEAEGYTVDYVEVDAAGRVDPAAWEAALSDDVALVTLLHANNETGGLQNVADLSAQAADRGILVHVDAVQSIGKLAVNVSDWPVHLLSLSAHKFHGPKGVGALYIRRRTRIEPLIVGGGQERLMRGGTENVPGIIGMGVAAEAMTRDLPPTPHTDHASMPSQVRTLCDALEAGILSQNHMARVNGGDAPRIDNTTNISFRDLEAEAILILLSQAGVCASSGSACSSGSLEPSHVLRAMRVDPRYAHGAIRFSLSRFNTREEVDHVLSILPGLLERLTALQTGPRA